MTETLRLALEVKTTHPQWRHKKRGTVYKEIGRAKLQTNGNLSDGATMVVYQGEDGKIWVREEEEFHDGRFEQVWPEKQS
jgi:hypothetical protein